MGGSEASLFLLGALPAVMESMLQAKIKVKNSVLFMTKSICGFVNYFKASVFPR
jgi:hypothetical protein